MKIRNGFVSNSSSSSFCIYGVVISVSKLRELLGVVEDPNLDRYDNNQQLDEALSKLDGKVEYYRPGGDSTIYLGLSWDSVKDTETGAQFKQRAHDAVKQVLGTDVHCKTLSESWYDG